MSLKRNTKKSLSKLARENNIDVRTVIRYTGAFEKVGGRWEALGDDTIDRGPKPIYSRGRLVIISPADYRTASIISDYNNDVKHYFDHPDDESVLRRYRGLAVKDRKGNLYRLETNPKKLKAAKERTVDQEYPEWYEEHN